MPTNDINKRNEVLRRHHPEFFDDEAPARHGKFQTEEGDDIDALMMAFDDDGRLTEAWITTKTKVVRLSCDDPDLQASLRAIRENPPPTDTLILDVAAISRAAGKDMTGRAQGAMMFCFGHLQGMTASQMADAFLDDEGAQRVETLSLDEFFDGNGDDSSIAPNTVGYGHPGIAVFRKVLTEIQARSEVVEVRIGVHEWPHPDEEDWIAGEQVFFWVRGVEADELLEWLAPLNPEGVATLGDEFRVIGGPAAGAGVTTLWTTWD